MSLVPNSNSYLNDASLAGSYLSLMFCAFPKPLSKRSGLGLRVTSNDNLFAVIFPDPSIRGARVITCRQQETCLPSSVSVSGTRAPDGEPFWG